MHGWTATGILQMQRLYGNRAVQRMIQNATRMRAPEGGGAQGAAPIQRKIRKVKKGDATSSHWTYLRSDAKYDYYDDGEPEPEVKKLKRTYDVMKEIEKEPLSDPEESDTEIDLKAKSGKKKVYRVKNVRDSVKVVRKLRKERDTGVGVRIGGTDGPIFRLKPSTGGTQFTLQSTSKAALVQEDGTQGTGFMPDRESGDPTAHGDQASYEHVCSELRNHKSSDVAKDMCNKFFNETDYPTGKYSPRAIGKMSELFALLTIAEPFRADYALILFVACIEAMKRGESMETVLYKGKGQIKALHVGASSHKKAKISGQLMEQNIGKGVNDPHPTQKNMNISAFDFKDGLERTVKLFEAANEKGAKDLGDVLDDHLLKPFRALGPGGSGTTSTTTVTTITPGNVLTTRKPGNWADVVIMVTGIKLTIGQDVSYNGKTYVVKNITPAGWVLLDEK